MLLVPVGLFVFSTHKSPLAPRHVPARGSKLGGGGMIRQLATSRCV